jgi:hypothetical protein
MSLMVLNLACRNIDLRWLKVRNPSRPWYAPIPLALTTRAREPCRAAVMDLRAAWRSP